MQSILAPAPRGPLLQTQADGATYAVGCCRRAAWRATTPPGAGLYGSGTWDWFTQALASNDDLLSGSGSMPDDYAASVQTTGRLSLGAAVAARLEQLGDADWFRWNWLRCYRFEALGASTGQAPWATP